MPRKSEEVFAVDDIDGNDVLDVFDDFCRGEKGLIQLNDSERFLKIGEVEKGEDYRFVPVQSGRAGVVGSVVNTVTAEEKYGYGTNEAGMVSSRFFLSRREGYGYALACIERVPNDAGSTAVLSAFERHFRSRRIKATVRRERIQQEQALKAFKGIEDIEVRRYTQSADRSDGLKIESKYISHIARHKRNRFFPLHVVRDISEDKGALASILGIPEDYNGKEDVMVRLKGWDGSSKLFVLGDDLHVPLVEVLSDSGERPLSDEEFLDRCVNITANLCDRLDRML